MLGAVEEGLEIALALGLKVLDYLQPVKSGVIWPTEGST